MANRAWKLLKAYEDVLFDFFEEVARIALNRPEVYNAFRPETNVEMLDAMEIARERNDIDVVVFTGAGDKAFCSGGDQNVKGSGGYIGADGVPRSNVLDLHKRIRELWFLCQQYSAQQAMEMGMVNRVVSARDLEDAVLEWCRIMQKRSPLTLRMIKRALNAELDGQHGLMQLAGDATLLYYLTEEAQEGKNAFLEKRDPDFKRYSKFP